MVKQRREGRFFGPRIDCERVPMLPVGIMRSIIDDSSGAPYLLLWQNPWYGTVDEVAEISRVAPPACFPDVEALEVRRPGQRITDVHVFGRPLPRNGGTDIFIECPTCQRLRRALYGWTVGGPTTRSVYRSQWQCREWARLRYASEGGALLVRSRGFLGKMLGVGRAKRPEPWLPKCFPIPLARA